MHRLDDQSFDHSAATTALPGLNIIRAARAWASFWLRVDPRLIVEHEYRGGPGVWIPEVDEIDFDKSNTCWIPIGWSSWKSRAYIATVGKRRLKVRPQRAAIALSMGLPLLGTGSRWSGGCLVCDEAACCNPWHLAAVPSSASRGGSSPRRMVGLLSYNTTSTEICAELVGLSVERVRELRVRVSADQSLRGSTQSVHESPEALDGWSPDDIARLRAEERQHE